MSPTTEELNAKLEQDKRDFENLKELLLASDPLDEDGYPTEEALTLIEKWHWSDADGWFEFIKSIWWSADWGWSEKEEPHDWKEDVIVSRIHASTGGWSGNESIIRAMEANTMMWHLNWVQSRRGGHYIFEPKEIK